MSKYTTEVRFICENASGLGESKGYTDVDTIITNAIPKIFTFTFPIFDESYRTVLEKKILKHFYTREICEETVGLWKLRLDTKLNEIMPYYNKLYKSELLEFNPLYTANLNRTKKTDYDSNRKENENISDTSSSNRTTTNNGTVNNSTTNNGTVNNSTTNNGSVNNSTTNKGTVNNSTSNIGEVDTTNNSTTTGSESGTSNNTSTDLYSDTPQGALSGVESNTYLTNARKVTDNGSTSSNTNNTNSFTGKVESSETVTNNTSTSDEETNNTITSNEETNNTTTSDKGTNNTTTSDNGTDNSTGTYGRIRGNTDALTSTEDYLETIVGYEGVSGSDLLLKFRETFLNIDLMVINELEDLFFQLW